MVKTDNSAGRLHEILSQARNQQNMSVINMWTKVLGGSPGDKTDFIRRMSYLLELVDEVKDKISKLEGLNTQLYLSRFPDIEAAVKSTNYDAGWDGGRQHLNEAAMLNLAHCAEALSRHGEAPIPETELTELCKSIDELSEKLLGSSIAAPLRETILDLLETIRRSISEYRIRGAAGMRKELAYCIGVFVQNHELFRDEAAKEEVNEFGSILSRFHELVNIALKLQELGFDFTQLPGMIGMG